MDAAAAAGITASAAAAASANATCVGSSVAAAAAGAAIALTAALGSTSPTASQTMAPIDASLITSSLITTTTSFLEDELLVNGTEKSSGLPQPRYSFTLVVVLAITAGALSLVTVIGNSMVMISFKIDKQLQTISNYFLFSLAVADLAIGLISMPLYTVSSLMGYWPLGPVICDAWLTLDYLNSNASVLNLLIISFDRYFSVTRPLTYRAKRTTSRAAVMIGCAWGISLLVWTPWIYSWPYIEGERTVPETQCYIQFIETNRYITFTTAIAAFYVPVTVMCILYWRIWRETEKRQKDLPNLQAGKKDSSKRSNSSNEKNAVPLNGANRLACAPGDDGMDLDEWRRQRSESGSGGLGGDTGSDRDPHYVPTRSVGTGDDVSYSGWKGSARWGWLRRWCVAWYYAGREADECDDTPSDLGYATPVSVETPVQSSVSRGTSLNMIRDPYAQAAPAAPGPQSSMRGINSAGGTAASAAAQTAAAPAVHYDTRSLPPTARLSGRSLSSDSVYTILIRLPAEVPTEGSEGPSIKMITDDLEQQGDLSASEGMGASGSSGAIASGAAAGSATTGIPDRAAMRRPSQMPDIRIPLNAKIIPKQLASHGGSRALLSNIGTSKPQVKKRKKTQEKKAERKAAKTLSAILLTFIITWTPYNILVLVKPLTSCADCIPPALWEFFYYLCYINSTINPMCYALCNASFRRTYVRILKCKWHNRNRTNRGFYN